MRYTISLTRVIEQRYARGADLDEDEAVTYLIRSFNYYYVRYFIEIERDYQNWIDLDEISIN